MKKEKEFKNFEFNNQVIEFELEKKSVMVNATKMTKCFPEKKTKDFLKLKSTKEFIKALDEKYGNNYQVQGEDRPLESKENLTFQDAKKSLENDDEIIDYDVSENILKVVYGGRNNGTWMHELLALDFAAWLDVKFRLWIYETIRVIMYELMAEYKDATQDKISYEYEYEQKKKNMLKTNKEYQELIEIENKLINSSKRRRVAIGDFNKQLKINFFKKTQL